jgi:hypothetical protein
MVPVESSIFSINDRRLQSGGDITQGGPVQTSSPAVNAQFVNNLTAAIQQFSFGLKIGRPYLLERRNPRQWLKKKEICGHADQNRAGKNQG